MALHNSLNIYRDAYSLLRACAQPLADMPRNARAIFGVCLRDCLFETLEQIRDINVAKGADKVPFIDTLLKSLREIEVLIRVCHDKRWLPNGAYADAARLVVSVGKQASGLRRTYAPAT